MSEKKDFNIDLSSELDNAVDNGVVENDIDFSSMDLKKRRQIIKSYKYKLRLVWYVVFILLLIAIVLYGIGLHFQLKYKNLELNTVQQFLVDKLWTYVIPYIENYIGNQDVEQLDINIDDISSKNKNEIYEKIVQYLSNQKIDYFTKYTYMTEFVKQLNEALKKEYEVIQKLEKDLRDYAFLPKEIADILDESDVQGIILTINSIKLYLISTQRIDSPKDLDRLKYIMRSEISNYRLISSVKDRLQRGEFLVRKFLEIYLTSLDATKAEYDFINYVKFYTLLNETNFDERSAKIYYNFLRAAYKRLNSEINPSIIINFNSFDPKKKEMSFSIEVNTDIGNVDVDNVYQYHINKIVSLLNMIRWSRLIIWENIDVRKLKVNIKKDKYAANKQYLNTVLSFTVKMQPDVQREIYDFIYKK